MSVPSGGGGNIHLSQANKAVQMCQGCPTLIKLCSVSDTHEVTAISNNTQHLGTTREADVNTDAGLFACQQRTASHGQ